jgi:pimeloyl-ACP methyl ester carboxylesterase
MIIPHFWAEARVQYRRKGKQITIRRFGWSDASQEEAQHNAQARADEALARAVSGEPLPRRERKLPYGGGEGLPIREEVVARFDDTVITRNSYGARCLNTSGVLFADIDFPDAPSARMVGVTALLLLAASAGALYLLAAAGKIAGTLWVVGAMGALLTMTLASTIANRVRRLVVRVQGGPETLARKNVQRFMSTRPDWLVHVYRTPAGLRLLATHRLFDPLEAEVAECFKELGTDPMYAAMCLSQRCFRARVSAKPWRIGIQDRLTPRPGVWPVAPERLPQRRAWLERYDRAAAGFAACRFVESLGSGVSAPAAHAVQQLHDELCQARADLPIA